LAKSSFSLFETILSLIILSVLVSGFLQFTYSKEDKTISLHTISNLLLTQQSHANIYTSSWNYTRDGSTIFLNAGNTITRRIYEGTALKLEYSHVNFPKTVEIAFKEVE
jgi:Tfp pilus assembly protein PilV